MKNLYCPLIVALLLAAGTISAQNIVDLETFEKAIKPGTQLTYDVTTKTHRYQLFITIKNLGEEIAFDWKSTDSTPKSGTVRMNANAVAKAAALFNTFNGGQDVLDKETCMLLSKQVFNQVASTSATTLKLKGVADTSTALNNTIGEFNFNLDGNLVAIPGWELESSGDPKYTVDVLESTKLPLIYKLDLGWSMILTEVKRQ